MLVVFAVGSMLVSIEANFVSSTYPPPKVPFSTHLIETLTVGALAFLFLFCVGWLGVRRNTFFFQKSASQSSLYLRLPGWKRILPTFILLLIAAASQLWLCFAVTSIQLDFAVHNIPWVILATLVAGASAFIGVPGKVLLDSGAARFEVGANAMWRRMLAVLTIAVLVALVIYVAVLSVLG